MPKKPTIHKARYNRNGTYCGLKHGIYLTPLEDKLFDFKIQKVGTWNNVTCKNCLRVRRGR